MSREHSNIAQLSKHNLGGTICVPNITVTTPGNAEAARFEQARDDLERYAKVFNIDFEILRIEMMERITTGLHWREAITWARHRIANGLAAKIAKVEE